jgi:hypothetical protein
MLGFSVARPAIHSRSSVERERVVLALHGFQEFLLGEIGGAAVRQRPRRQRLEAAPPANSAATVSAELAA